MRAMLTILFGLIVGMMLVATKFSDPGPSFGATNVKSSKQLDWDPPVNFWGTLPKAQDLMASVEEEDEPPLLTLDTKDKLVPDKKPPKKGMDACECKCGCASCQCAGNVVTTSGEGADDEQGKGRVRALLKRIFHRRGGRGRCGG